jgi:Kef-type K+ transport system membrane component KefB
MTLIVALLLLLVVARLGAEIAERYGQPAMIGEIAAGLVLGPSLLNLVRTSQALTAIADLGILLLMLLAGMEIDLGRLYRAFTGRNLWISITGFVLPLALGVIGGIALGLDGLRCAFLGLCVAITALPVSIRILMDLGRLDSDVGQRIVSAAIANDVLALLALGVILELGSASAEWMVGLRSAAWTSARILLFMAAVAAVSTLIAAATRRHAPTHRVAERITRGLRGKEPVFAVTLVFVLAFAALADALGLHFVVGAFFGAVLISRELLGQENFDDVRRTASGITMGLLAPLFFAAIGLEFDAHSLTSPALIAIVLTVAFAGKILAGRLGGWLAGLTPAESWALGLGLNGRGIMELVVARIALSAGLIGPQLFSVLVLMGVLTTMVTPILLKRAFRKVDALAAARPRADLEAPASQSNDARTL